MAPFTIRNLSHGHSVHVGSELANISRDPPEAENTCSFQILPPSSLLVPPREPLTSGKLKLLAASLHDGYVDLPFAKHQLHVTQPVPQAGEKEKPSEVPGTKAKGDCEAAAARETRHLDEVVGASEVDGVGNGIQATESHVTLEGNGWTHQNRKSRYLPLILSTA